MKEEGSLFVMATEDKQVGQVVDGVVPVILLALTTPQWDCCDVAGVQGCSCGGRRCLERV